MSETNTTYEPTAADVKEAALALGMPQKTENERRAERDAFEADLVNATISDTDLDALHERSYTRGLGNHHKISLGRRVLAGAGLSLAAIGALGTPQGQEVVSVTTGAVHELVTNQDDTVQPVEAGSPEAGIYNAKPGDTPNGIALQVEANIDGIAGNEEHRELQTDISKQAGKDGLMPGEDIVVPAAADTNPEQPGVQL